MSNYLNLLVKSIEDRLRELDRKPAWLAQKAGMPPGTLYRILKKERVPSLETIEAIENGFGLRPGELLRASTQKLESINKALEQTLAKAREVEEANYEIPLWSEDEFPKKKELLSLIDRLTEDQISSLLPSVRGLLGEASVDENEVPLGRRRK